MGNPEGKRSYLILIGGAEDKTGNKEILKKAIDVSGARTVSVITTASSYPDEVFRNYDHAFRQLGTTEVYHFDIRSKHEADRPEYFEKLEKTELMFLGGGDQVKLVEELEGTALLDKILQRFYSGTLCIAGTSAGAAAASNPMIYDGDYRGFLKGSVNTGNGFGLLPDITIDTHFLNRERLPRLTQYLTAGRSTKGIGLDEDTSLFISPDLTAEIVGSGMVTLLRNDNVTFSNFNEIESDKKFSVNNLRFGFLSAGMLLNLKSWEVVENRESSYTNTVEADIFKSNYLLNS